MKWTVFNLFFFIHCSCCTIDFAIAQQLQLSDTMVEQRVEKMHLRVARGYAVVEGQHSTLFIDYAGGLLHNFSKETDRCKRFDISTPTHDDFNTQQSKVFGEIRILEGGTTKEGSGNELLVGYKVLYAPKAMMLRGVTVASMEQFGLTFRPRVTEFIVAQNHADLQKLQEIAHYNQATGVVNNALVLQLDLTHLLSHLGGVPVRKIESEALTELLFSFEKKSKLASLLPARCSDL